MKEQRITLKLTEKQYHNLGRVCSSALSLWWFMQNDPHRSREEQEAAKRLYEVAQTLPNDILYGAK